MCQVMRELCWVLAKNTLIFSTVSFILLSISRRYIFHIAIIYIIIEHRNHMCVCVFFYHIFIFNSFSTQFSFFLSILVVDNNDTWHNKNFSHKIWIEILHASCFSNKTTPLRLQCACIHFNHMSEYVREMDVFSHHRICCMVGFVVYMKVH